MGRSMENGEMSNLMIRRIATIKSHLMSSGILATLLLGILPLDAGNCGSDLSNDELLREHGWTIDTFSLGEGDRSGVQRVFAQGRMRCPASDIWTVINGATNSGRWPSIKESVLESYEGNSSIRRSNGSDARRSSSCTQVSFTGSERRPTSRISMSVIWTGTPST